MNSGIETERLFLQFWREFGYDSQEETVLLFYVWVTSLSLPLSYLIELKSNAAIINQANVQLEDFKSDLEAKLPH